MRMIEQLLSAVSCGPPPQIANGTEFGGFPNTPGATARYFCDFGTNLVGNRTISCRDAGTWDDPPMCVPQSVCAYELMYIYPTIRLLYSTWSPNSCSSLLYIST